MHQPTPAPTPAAAPTLADLTRRRALIVTSALLAALAVNALALADAGFTPWWHALGAATGNVAELAIVAAVAWVMASRLAPGMEDRRRTALLTRHAAAAVVVVSVAVAINRVGRLLPHTRAEHHPSAESAPGVIWLACWFLFLYGAVAALTHAAHAVARLRERELEATRAELRALRAQLNPHFLFNALHSVGVLVRRDPARAEDAVEQLGDLLRYVLRASREDGGGRARVVAPPPAGHRRRGVATPAAAGRRPARIGRAPSAGDAASADMEVPLAEELAFVRAYLDVERLRFGERLRVVEEVEPASARASLPALLLQPLVENAVKYAVGARCDGATVRLIARQDRDSALGDMLRLGVVDDGPGRNGGGEHATPGCSMSTTGQWAVGEGMGLAALQRRLAACYPDRHRMDVVEPEGGGFAVWILVPWRPRPEGGGVGHG